MTKLHQLADLGQAIRYDHICRSFITSGDLQALIDEGLRGITGSSEALALQGQIAIANAKASYARFREMLSGDRWDRLAAQDAHVQRPLGASTKNPSTQTPSTWTVSLGQTRSTLRRQPRSMPSVTTARLRPRWRPAWTRPAPNWRPG
jgi:hypothetical protein